MKNQSYNTGIGKRSTKKEQEAYGIEANNEMNIRMRNKYYEALQRQLNNEENKFNN